MVVIFMRLVAQLSSNNGIVYAHSTNKDLFVLLSILY